jgi:heat shock protein HtpX
MLRTAMLLATLTALLIFVGWLIGGIFGGSAALAIAAILNFSMYWWSDKIVLRMYSARPTDEPRITKIVNSLTAKAGLPKPALYIINQAAPNAFATGRNPSHSAIAITQGLLQLDDVEIEAVLAHELAHIKNRDMLVSTMAATIAGAISWLAQIGYWSLFAAGERKEGTLIAFLLIIIFAPLAALLVRLAISRGREYLADETGVLITKKPLALASALRKISEMANRQPIHGSTATSHLWIVNPFKKDWFTTLFSTHPPIAKRIARLESMGKK